MKAGVRSGNGVLGEKHQEREGDMDSWGKAGHQEETWGWNTDGEKAGCQPTQQDKVRSGEQSQCLSLSGSLARGLRSSQSWSWQEPKRFVNLFKYIFYLSLGTRDTEMNKTGREPSFLDLTWEVGISAAGQCCKEPSCRRQG